MIRVNHLYSRMIKTSTKSPYLTATSIGSSSVSPSKRSGKSQRRANTMDFGSAVQFASLEANSELVENQNLFVCYARTSSQALKKRFLQVNRSSLRLMHLKRDSDQKMSTTIKEDLSKAHIIKKSPISNQDLSGRGIITSILKASKSNSS